MFLDRISSEEYLPRKDTILLQTRTDLSPATVILLHTVRIRISKILLCALAMEGLAFPPVNITIPMGALQPTSLIRSAP